MGNLKNNVNQYCYPKVECCQNPGLLLGIVYKHQHKHILKDSTIVRNRYHNPIDQIPSYNNSATGCMLHLSCQSLFTLA